MAQSLLSIIFSLNFVKLYNYYKMFSKYQITKKYISDIINIFYNSDYTNLTVMVQVFRMSTKIIYWKLDRKVLKNW